MIIYSHFSSEIQIDSRVYFKIFIILNFLNKADFTFYKLSWISMKQFKARKNT